MRFKLSLLGKKKPKFIYEFSGCKDFESREIHDPYELIKHVTDENYRFNNEYLSGSVVITKIRNNLEGKVYYAQQINLPQAEDVHWPEVLDNFFTRKSLDYDASLLEEIENIESINGDSPEQSTYTLEDFEADLGYETPERKVTPENPSTEQEAGFNPMNEIPSNQDQESPSEVVTISRSELQALQETLASQQQAMQELQGEMSQMRSGVVPVLPTTEVIQTPGSPLMNETSKKSLQEDPLVEQMTHLADTVQTDESVQQLLHSTKNEFDHALRQFITTETEKIQAEIQQLDKRDQIETTITQQLSITEQARLKELETQLKQAKDQELAAEKKRHEQALKEIENTYQQQLTTQSNTLKDTFKKQRDQDIKAEYDRQTEQLARILQGKMDELKLRQLAMNMGLEENFKAALANFNREHQQVIEVVEQKKHGTPIDLDERRKLRHA